MRNRVSIVALVAALAATAGCGGSSGSPDAPKVVPAAGANTPPAGTPGVPKGASYDVNGRRWLRLSQAGQFRAATDFVADNPGRCKGVDVAAVAFYVTNSYGNDFPPDIPAADVLAEGCDADRQS